MELSKARDWADFVLKTLSCIAIIAAGTWALYQWYVTDSDETNVQVDVSAEVQAYSDTQRMLVIHAKAKNVGKVGVTAGGKGFFISVRALPNSLKPGAVDLDAQPEVARVELVKARYPGGYILEPGVQHDEVFAAIVNKGATYSAHAEIDLGEDTEEDGTAVVRVD